ncbi:MAG TPA: glutamine amidotransferase [Tissierellia bacterium]|nr:glutamine amidotransferase [Tissierellia bacterium]
MKIGHLFPDLLNLYGDLGNIRTLQRRLEWRGLDVSVENYRLSDEIDFSRLDLVVLGGGSDREQQIVCQRLQTIKDDFRAYIEDGGVVLAICGGYQLLGQFYESSRGRIAGLGILEIDTVQHDRRLIGNIVLDSRLIDQPIVGFENHAGRTNIYRHEPLGKVITGYGNDESGGYEGVVYKHVIGTYLHGPLLPKNPKLADWLLQKARQRAGQTGELSPLDDRLEHQANQAMYHRLIK